MVQLLSHWGGHTKMENLNEEYGFFAMNYRFWFVYKGETHTMDPHMEIPTAADLGFEEEDGFSEHPNAGERLMDVLGMTDEEADQAVVDGNWNRVRDHRDKFLSRTDWSQGADVPENIKSKYLTFRQALRDITNQSDVENITWPTIPE